MQLKDVCKINMGQSPDSSSYNENGDGIPFYQGNADFGERHPVTRVWCNSPKKTADIGDILISVRAPIGALNYAKEKCCIGRGLAAIVPDKEKVSSDFIFWMLKGKNEELNRKGTGSTFKAIGRKALEEIAVPDVSFTEQNLYANNLEKVYSIILIRKQELQTLDELIKARFVDMFGSIKKNNKNWETSRLRNIAEVRGRVGWKGYKKEDLREFGPLVLGATHLTDNGSLDLSEPVYLSYEKFKESPEIALHMNDLIFTQRGNTIGKVGLVTNEIGEATINPCVLILRPIDINPIYFQTYFLMDETKNDMWALNSGSAQPMITQKAIGDYIIMLPPLELQNEFAEFVQEVDKSKVVVQKALDEAQLLFDSLMQEYFG